MEARSKWHTMAMLFALVMVSAALRAQQPAGIQKENGVYTLHEDTHLALLDVTVTDKKGNPVTGLTKDDFKLLEDGQPQTIKFFEEHAPVDPAQIAKEKAAALANQPPNTFTSYEPFSGRPVAVLLLNQLYPFEEDGFFPLHQRMLDFVKTAPPDTPFAVYLLDSELHLIQPVTTDHALLLARINEIWRNPHFGSEKLINPTKRLTLGEEIPIRRKITADAMEQLISSLKATPGKKNLFLFTGNFQCAVVRSDDGCPDPAFAGITRDDSRAFTCGLMDTLEQGRISIYRYYRSGELDYGFGCRSAPADQRTIFETTSHYYTLYYTPTNQDWNGKYRTTTVEAAETGMHLAYRKGYYGTPENAETHYYSTKEQVSVPVPAASDGSRIAATAVAAGTGGAKSLEGATANAAPDPTATVFNVQVIPAKATVIPASTDKKISDADKKRQEYRELTLRFSMPASQFKVMQSDAGGYATRLEIGAVAYGDDWPPYSDVSEVGVNFNSSVDPRITKSTITATLTVHMPQHAKNRWLYVSVRDLATGQFGSMVIPMEQVKMPGAQ